MVSTSLPPTRAGIPSPPTPTTHRTTAPGNGYKALPGRKLPSTSTRGTGLSLRRMPPGRSPHTIPRHQVSEWRRYIDQQDIPQERRLFLGDNYVKVDDGKWRSLDGKRQFRAKQNDYLGRHGMGLPKVLHQRHVHFEFVQLNNSKTGYKVIKNIHVPIK